MDGRILRDEGLIVSRQGSGVFVRERTERPVGLRPHMEQAFTENRVSLDFAGFSGGTLRGAVQEPLDRIRAGRLHQVSLRIRILLPDPETPWTLPARTDDLADDPAFRARMDGIANRHTSAIVDSVAELAELGVMEDATAEVRLAACRSTGRTVAVVSNNSAEAVAHFLKRAGWTDLVRLVEGRNPSDPSLMKPHPHVLLRTLRDLNAPPESAAIVGDSITDIEAGLAADV